MAVVNLIKFAVWPGLPYLADSYNAKMVCFGEGAMELWLFSFFLSIYSRCGVPAFLAARHTTMCLVVIITNNLLK